jgi:hypothetical protein
MTSDLASPIQFLLFFGAMWCSVNILLSLISGWYQISKKFPSPEDFQTTQSYRLTSMTLGVPFFPVSYNHCIFVLIGDAGIRISILFLFRILSSPILIPWSEIKSVNRSRYMLVNSTVINLKNDNRRFRFYWKTGEAIFEACKARQVPVEDQRLERVTSDNR